MTVYLVGAGPGDADLLTLRAARLLGRADVVIHDRLVGPDVLEMIAPWAERIDVGKDPNGARVTQESINEVLVEQAGRHSVVVRLKGGDPYVFGRGGEEALALQRAGMHVEVVPGITSALAAPAAAGIPVTHRGTSSGFTVITGFQSAESTTRVDWNAVASIGTTLVILMGAAQATVIRDRLLAGGAPPDEPVAVITRATTPTQSTHRCALRDLDAASIENPSVIVVGPAAALDLAHIAESDVGARVAPFFPPQSLTPASAQGDNPWP